MIEVTHDGAVTTLTINRPDKANSLTKEMLEALDAGVAEAQGAVLVVTGRGRVFSAGADLEAARAGLARDAVWERLSSRIAAFPGLSIAALNGTVAGGAMGMVLACDLRVAVPSAKAFYPVMSLGFLPQPSDPGRLAALVGLSRAKVMFMTGEKIDARMALAWGLFDRLAEGAEMADVIQNWSKAAVSADPRIRAGIKAFF